MLLYKKTFVTVSVGVAMQTLRVGWEQLLTSVARSINEVENQARKLRSLAKSVACSQLMPCTYHYQ